MKNQMEPERKIIFDLTNYNNEYKGVLFAEVDNEEVRREINDPFPTPKGYIIGVMAMIWTDEQQIWNLKVRFHYPSGRKDVVWKIYEDEFKSGVHINETYVLHDLYNFPLTNKLWQPNPDGTPEGIFQLIKQADMIERLTVRLVE